PRPTSGSKKGSKTRLRPPRSAAVTLTCPDGEYSRFMAEARRRIMLADLRIPGSLRVRRALTGALLVEVPALNAGAPADRLAEELRKLANEEGPEYRVQRPVRIATLRLTGLDLTLRVQKVTEAVALAGGCLPTEVSVGGIRVPQRGMATALVRCPQAAASKVATAERVQVGWTLARMVVLPVRAALCFRCLERGHVRGRCGNTADRSDTCYRCGNPGHRARDCRAASE
ncbi:hypothetical protein EAI_01710, partial [Harpegnathos saltator]